MGWFNSETQISELQKAIVVSLSGTLIGLDYSGLDQLLAIVRKRIGITEGEYNRNIDTLNNLISMYGLYALDSFSSLPKDKRREIRDIFSYAFNSGMYKNNPEVKAFYEEVVRRLKL